MLFIFAHNHQLLHMSLIFFSLPYSFCILSSRCAPFHSFLHLIVHFYPLPSDFESCKPLFNFAMLFCILSSIFLPRHQVFEREKCPHCNPILYPFKRIRRAKGGHTGPLLHQQRDEHLQACPPSRQVDNTQGRRRFSVTKLSHKMADCIQGFWGRPWGKWPQINLWKNNFLLVYLAIRYYFKTKFNSCWKN